jgi:hypothetical protein
MNLGRNKLYRKKENLEIAGKLNYHEQLKAARMQERTLDEGDRKVRLREDRY